MMRRNPRAHRQEGVEALGTRPLAVALLDVTRTDVVSDGVAEDVVESFFWLDVASHAPDDDCKLDFVLDVFDKVGFQPGNVLETVARQKIVEELLDRMGELPKDKLIVAHCSTGIRAEMAYHKLTAAGYKAGFLNAEIEIDKAGNFKVTAQ